METHNPQTPAPMPHPATLCKEVPRQLEPLVLRHLCAETEEDQFPTQPRLGWEELFELLGWLSSNISWFMTPMTIKTVARVQQNHLKIWGAYVSREKPVNWGLGSQNR